jgi:hypothetical protein
MLVIKVGPNGCRNLDQLGEQWQDEAENLPPSGTRSDLSRLQNDHSGA